MNNKDAYKSEIEKLGNDKDIGYNQKTHHVFKCKNCILENCLFFHSKHCNEAIAKWLCSECTDEIRDSLGEK